MRQPPPRPQLSPQELEWKAKALQALGWETRWNEQAAADTAIRQHLARNEGRGLRGQGAHSAEMTLALVDETTATPEFNRFHAKLKIFEKVAKQDRTPHFCEDLRASAQSYLDVFDSGDDVFQNDPGNIHRKETCEATLKELTKFKLANDYAQLGGPPWDSWRSMQATAIKTGLDIASLPPGQQRAEALGHGGASPAFWINRKAPFGTTDSRGQKVAQEKTFIFKPSVESAEEGFPPHGEPAREALTGRMADLLNASMDLSLPVPDTHVVTLDSASLPEDALKELVRKQKIKKQDAYTGSVQQFADSKGQMKEQMDAAARAQVPAKAAQALAVLDIVTLNTDRHGGNFVVQDGPNGEPVMVPIDHGLCFPPPGAEDRLSTKISTTHNALLSLPANHRAFTDEMQQSIARMDPNVQTAAMKRERESLASMHPEIAETLSDGALENSRRAAMFLKLAAGQLSPAAVQVAIGRHHEVLLDPRLTDTAFATAAAGIIAEMVPKQEALKEFFLMPPELRAQMESDLAKLGWIGRWADDDSVLSDPAVAIKIWKSGQKPPAESPVRDPNRPPQKAARKSLDDMAKVFPEMTKFSDMKEVTDALDAWEDWQALPDGMAALYEAMSLLGAQGAGRKRARANVVEAMRYIKRAAEMKASMTSDKTDGVTVSIFKNAEFIKSILPFCPKEAARVAQKGVQEAESILDVRVPSSPDAKAERLARLIKCRDDLTDAARVWLLDKYDTLIKLAPQQANFKPNKDTGTIAGLKKARDLVLGGSIQDAYMDIKSRDPMLAAAQ